MPENRLLGIIASHRRVGNSEIVVKAVAERMNNWRLSMIRLPLLNIMPCKGCYACLRPGVACNLGDDMEWLLDCMSEADAIIVAAPNYVLGPVGIMKMMADRALQASPRYDLLRSKRTAVALTLGREDYRGYADTALLGQVLALGLQASGLELFYGTHPGEVALSEDFDTKTNRLAQSLLTAGGPGPMVSDRCPRCHSDLFRIRNGVFECALCKSLARPEGDKLKFYYFHPEFSEEGKHEHMKWLLGKKQEYPTIKEKLSAVQDRYRDGLWLSPSGK